VDRPDDLRGAVVVPVIVRQRTDVDHARGRGPVAVELDRIEPDHEDEVGFVDVVVQLRGTEHLDRPEKERVIFAKRSFRFRAHDHRDAPLLREMLERTSDAVVVRIHSRDDDRPLAAAEQLRRPTRVQAIDRRALVARAVSDDVRRRRAMGARRCLTWNIARHLDVDRATARPQRLAQPAIDDVGRVRRRETSLPLRDWREE
jgi:hypothetical protein